MDEGLKKQYHELAEAHAKIAFGAGKLEVITPASEWNAWAKNAADLIRATLGEESSHYKNFQTAYAACNGRRGQVLRLISLFSQCKASA